MKPRIWRKSFSIRRRSLWTLRHVLQLERLEDRLNLSTLLGTSGDDTLAIEATGLNSGNYSLNGAAAVAFSDISTFHFDGLGGNDLLQIKHPAGGAFAPSGGITYDGGEGFDGVEVIGGGDSAGRYAPGTTSDSGTITVSANGVESTLQFTGLEPSTVSGMGSFIFVTQNSNDVLTIDTPAAGQNRISGTSGGMAFEALTFFNITNFTVDTGTNDGALPDDQITIDASGLVASGLVNFTVSSGAGADSLTVLSTNYSTPGSATGFAFQGGTGTDTFIGNADIGYTLGNSGVASSAGGTVAFTSVDQASLTGGAAANTFNVNSTSILANLAGAAGNDTFTFAAGATLAGGTIDGGGDSDALDYSASSTAVAVNLGLGTTGLAGMLQGAQEIPPQNTTANGTATVSNYDPIAKTFDIVVDVSNLAPGLVTGFHIHRNPVGVNGPIIIDFTPGGVPIAPLVPNATGGFTFTATGLDLDNSALGGRANEAAFLGGVTYVNVHTAAAPAGLIRGQLFSLGNVNLNAVGGPGGTASGTGGVLNIENVIGGMVGDGLIGSFIANALSGGPGSDVIVGAPNTSPSMDTLNGDAGSDVLVWSNGDGTDVMNGGPDDDIVQVNGSVTANDQFTVNANGSRVDFDRLSPGPFSLDIGTTETLTVNGIGGNDGFTVGSLAGVADLTLVNLNGFDGDDTFNVTPAANVMMIVRGNLPVPPAALGDTLNVDITGTMNPTLTSANTPTGFAGNYTFGDRSPVNFSGIESLGGVPTVSVSDGVAPEGEPVVFTLTLSQASSQQVTVRVNTASGTATGDVDYNQINSFADVVFPPGETMQTISVQTFEDTIDEPDETFFLNVLQTTNASVADGQGVGSIVDNPTVSVGDAAAEEGDAVVFTLTLSAPSNQQVTVRVNTAGGTATGDVDYNEINSFNDIVFPPGETTQTISVQTFEDALSEPDETFFLNVLQTTNAAVADGQGVGAINDDDISVSVDSNGKLIVDGSSEDDIVTITGIPVGVAGSGMYLVTTQAGPQVPQTQTVIGVTGDICVNLHAGNDQLTMNNAYVNGSIIIDMESGNDTVTLGNADVVSTRANLDVDLGTENDVLNGRRIFIAGNQNLVGGDGNDSMTFNGFASPFTLGTSASGNANWNMGNGDDTVQVIYAFIVGAFTVDLGGGADSLNIFGSAASGDVTFLGGVGNDSLSVDTNFFDASLLLDGGADNDTVFLANGLGTDVGTINTGAGDDMVTVRNETQVSATIDAGSGNDTVDVRSSAVDRFFALLGDDDDELTLFGNLLRLEADLDGGAGSADRLIDLGNDVRGTLRTRSFELFG